jgi:hypothetical protein
LSLVALKTAKPNTDFFLKIYPLAGLGQMPPVVIDRTRFGYRDARTAYCGHTRRQSPKTPIFDRGHYLSGQCAMEDRWSKARR